MVGLTENKEHVKRVSRKFQRSLNQDPRGF